MSNRPLRQAVVVSPMGLDKSGLAITIGRYVGALRSVAVLADGYVVGERHPEQGGTHALHSLAELSIRLEEHAPGVVLWVGLDSDDCGLEDQLDLMRNTRRKGWMHAVVPERTGHPEVKDYESFLKILAAGTVSGLVHLNSREASRWASRARVPTCVAGPPVPDEMLGVGRKRAAFAPPSPDLALVFIGRLSRRKGIDRLGAWWPVWQRALEDAGSRPVLNVYGRAFEGEADRIDAQEWLLSGTDVRWSPRFPTPAEMLEWPTGTVGVAVSRQEFDGIAVSEMLACGLPVLATPTSGHLALAGECPSVAILDDCRAFSAELTSLARNPSELRRRSLAATTEISASRSKGIVGPRLAAFLAELT